ncbi:MAG: M1 family metallopeptidase [Acidimicrobiales bacterium]
MTLDPHRLPSSVRPHRYVISLRPDLEAERFEGTVTIEVEVAEPVDEIVLNGDGLTIGSASITSGDAAPTPLGIEVRAETERLVLRGDEPVPAGDAVIEMSFAGEFDDQLVGLYLSRFRDADGVERKLATTQFEATHARKCFPCWDEPAFKATFELILRIDEGHEAVANGAEIGRRAIGDGTVEVAFAPTMVMSTYLVAFVVGPLEMSRTVDVDGTPLRVVHVPGKGRLAEFALEVGEFALRYFSDYFDLPYPGDKLDLVAIPDFAFGAMENLGCVTFREVLLLIDPTKATQGELQRAADVINHELAHMWFGDLVTMAWWNGLWLNEAFATFMEMRCTDAYRPDWQRWVDFGLSRTEAFDTDALASTRPIEFEVVSPSDAEGMFDILTYEKGAAVVRMLEQYLGEEVFRQGIRRYMRQHTYANADTADLWNAIESVSGEPVRRIMDSWILQGGFPVVSVERAEGSLVFAQEPMSYLGGGDAPRSSWAIPVRYRWRPVGDGETRTGRALVDQVSTEVAVAETVDWVVVNAEGAGFFRSRYDDQQLDRLADIAIDELAPVERYALVDDAWAAVLAGRSSSIAFLNLVEAMSGEGDRSVWQRLIAGLRQLDRLVDGEARERLQDIAHDVLAPALANLGLAPRPDDDDRSRQLRGDLVRALGTVADDPEIQEEAKRAAATGRRDPELVDASLLAASLDVVAARGDDVDFDDFVEAWRNAATPQEEIRYLYALADFPGPSQVERLHRLILDGEVRSQNAPFLLGRSLANREVGPLTWDFITGHWAKLNEMFATSSIVRMLAGIPRLDEAEQAEAAEAFFAANPVATGAQTLRQLLEKQRVQVALRRRESDRLTAFLTS